MYGDGGAWFTAPITSGYVQRGGYYGEAYGRTRSGAQSNPDTVVASLRRQVAVLTSEAVSKGVSVQAWAEPRGVNAARLIAALNTRIETLRAASRTAGQTPAFQLPPEGAVIAEQALAMGPSPTASMPRWVVPAIVGVSAAAALGTAAYLILRPR